MDSRPNPSKHVAQAEHDPKGLCDVCEAAVIWSRSNERDDLNLEFQPSQDAFQKSTLKCLLCAFLFHDIFKGSPPWGPQSDNETRSYRLYLERLKGIFKISVLRDDKIRDIPYPLPSGGLKGSYFFTHSSGRHRQIYIFC